MKIAVISDMHDNQANLKKCLSWCKQNNIQEMICCGDVANSDTLNLLASKFKNNIYLVKGNAELYQEEELKEYDNIFYYGKIGYFKIDKKQIGICHEPFLINKVLEKGVCDIVFYGHTHKPWEEKRSGAQIVNPGTLGGMFQKGTFAVWDSGTGKLELIILEMI